MKDFYVSDGFLVTTEPGAKNGAYLIVEKVPPGYSLWNIGRHHPDGYNLYARFNNNLHMVGDAVAVKL